MQDWVNITNGSIIAVSIQYRLGMLGYLASSTLMANGTANGGLLDQRAAMEWVGRHIDGFGGDPSKVTISVRWTISRNTGLSFHKYSLAETCHWVFCSGSKLRGRKRAQSSDLARRREESAFLCCSECCRSL